MSKNSNQTGDLGIQVFLYGVMFVVETLVIKLVIGVETWGASALLAITVGSCVTWAISHVPDILD